MISLQENNLEFKPVYTIKDHGLYRLATQVINSPKVESSGWE